MEEVNVSRFQSGKSGPGKCLPDTSVGSKWVLCLTQRSCFRVALSCFELSWVLPIRAPHILIHLSQKFWFDNHQLFGHGSYGPFSCWTLTNWAWQNYLIPNIWLFVQRLRDLFFFVSNFLGFYLANALVSGSGSEILHIQDIEPTNSGDWLSHATLIFFAWLSSATFKISISGVSPWILMLWKANLVYLSKRLRRWPQNEDDLKIEGVLKNDDDRKNENTT